MNRRKLCLNWPVAIAASWLLGGCASAAADEIRVAVAANFAPALTAIALRFEASTPHRVILVSGSSGKHYAQIINGAPYDALFSADAERPQQLEAKGVGIPGSRYTYAIGRLVLWSAQPHLVDPAGAVLRSDQFRWLAIGNPQHAPYGLAAEQVLRHMGLWDALQRQLVRGENIAQAYQFVVTGNAELGFVARAQLVAGNNIVAGSRWDVPASYHAPILQQAILLSEQPAALEFMEFARTPEAAGIIQEYGYDVPAADADNS